jgi:PilZ domain
MVRVPGFIKRSPRVDLRRPAVLIHSDGTETEVIVLDVSSGGFRLEFKEVPPVGASVRLRVERGHEFPAEIRWAQGTEAGGVFLGPGDPVEWRPPRVLPFPRSR